MQLALREEAFLSLFILQLQYNLHFLKLFQSNTLEETLKETYKDLSVYFAFCMQIQQIESTFHIQTDHRYLRNINKLFSHFLGVIAAGVSESYSVQEMQVSLGSQHCLARDSLEQRAQIRLVMRKLNSYFKDLLLYLLSM